MTWVGFVGGVTVGGGVILVMAVFVRATGFGWVPARRGGGIWNGRGNWLDVFHGFGFLLAVALLLLVAKAEVVGGGILDTRFNVTVPFVPVFFADDDV